MEQPFLIQRCELQDGKIVYDYMGSAEFEFGAQREALKRMFSVGLVLGSAPIKVGEKELTVYMVASTGFAFAEYQQYLQLMSKKEIRLKEGTDFDNAVRVKAELPESRLLHPETRAWFDIHNDVLWTLSEEDRKELVDDLGVIQVKYAEKLAASH